MKSSNIFTILAPTALAVQMYFIPVENWKTSVCPVLGWSTCEPWNKKESEVSFVLSLQSGLGDNEFLGVHGLWMDEDQCNQAYFSSVLDNWDSTFKTRRMCKYKVPDNLDITSDLNGILAGPMLSKDKKLWQHELENHYGCVEKMTQESGSPLNNVQYLKKAIELEKQFYAAVGCAEHYVPVDRPPAHAKLQQQLDDVQQELDKDDVELFDMYNKVDDTELPQQFWSGLTRKNYKEGEKRLPFDKARKLYREMKDSIKQHFQLLNKKAPDATYMNWLRWEKKDNWAKFSKASKELSDLHMDDTHAFFFLNLSLERETFEDARRLGKLQDTLKDVFKAYVVQTMRNHLVMLRSTLEETENHLPSDVPEKCRSAEGMVQEALKMGFQFEDNSMKNQKQGLQNSEFRLRVVYDKNAMDFKFANWEKIEPRLRASYDVSKYNRPPTCGL